MNEEQQLETQVQERSYDLGAVLVDSVLGAVERSDKDALLGLLEPLHPADIADLIEQIAPAKRSSFIALWGNEIDGDVLREIDSDLSADLIEEMSDDVVVEAVKDLETDDVVDLLEDLEFDQQERVLDALQDSDRVAVSQSMQYPEDSAGRLMQRELVMAPTHWTVGQIIDQLRSETDLPDQFYEVVIVDPATKPVGKVPLYNLFSHSRKTPLVDLMDEELRTIPVLQNQEDVAYAFNQYNMVSAPVVDGENRLVGVITMDDAMEVLDEEAEEDIKLLGGVGDESLTDSIINTTRQRFPWLAINLATSILASFVISLFASTIEAIVALAVLMPIIASMGGNAGTQSLTVAVRALATKDLTQSNALRVVRREVVVGLLNGLVFAGIVGAVGVFWYGSPLLGVVLGLAMVINMLVAGLAGILVPLTLERFNFDPALGSSALVTTVTDVVGFFAFLGFAAWILL